jgi:periodic tryptophan protein 1
VWDVKDNAPACLHSEATKLGPVYSVGFSPDSPLVVAAGGGKGKLRVWNVGENTAVQARFAERIKALQS